MRITYFFFTIVLLFLAPSLSAQLWLPNILSEGMVLQQKSNVKLWGKSIPGETVKIEDSWDNKVYSAKTANDSTWQIKIQTPTASYQEHTLSFSVPEKNIVLKNVQIGEVWFCGGQSNMEMPLKGFGGQPVENSIEEILSPNKNIHCYLMQREGSLSPKWDCEGKWLKANPQTVQDFTAVGYYFAKYIQNLLDVPVAIIHCNWGGSKVEAWMSKEKVLNFPKFIIPDETADLKKSYAIPTTLYNGMINPIIGYGLKGFLWYQGESNRGDYKDYPALFATMHKEWLDKWENINLPFYFCQIAPYNYGDNDGRQTAFMREAQLKISQTIPNTGMAVLMDAGDEACIHPANKKVAGQRLALQAIAQTYGYNKVAYRSPEYKSVEFKEGKGYIRFNYFGAMGITPRFGPIIGFEIAGEDRKFVKAEAKFDNVGVVVWNNDVKNPVAIRYAFKNYVECNLIGANGLPVSSFRTDEWEE